MEYSDIELLKGKTLTKVHVTDYKREIHFHLKEGGFIRMYHDQDCCEYVNLEDVVGDLGDLVGSPLTMAEEASEKGGEFSSTWTYYKFATIKGYVDLRWLGESNGYYSERVDLQHVFPDYIRAAGKLLKKEPQRWFSGSVNYYVKNVPLPTFECKYEDGKYYLEGDLEAEVITEEEFNQF